MKISIRPLIVFLILFVLLILKSAVPHFADPDPFYHAQMAVMIRDIGLPDAFPWFAFTDWPKMYVDQHYLYHILLIPFVTFFEPLVGMKMAAIVFGMIAWLTLYKILKAIKAPWPDILIFCTALSAPFVYRLAFARAVSLSVAMLLLISWTTLSGKKWMAFIASALYVWLYHGYPTALLSVFAVIVAQRFTAHLFKTQRPCVWPTVWPVLLGTVTGIVINPTFPNNVLFSFLDIFKIGVLNQAGTDVIPGNEWGAVMLGPIAESSAVVALVFLLSILLFVGAALSKKVQLDANRVTTAFTFLFLASGYILLTIRSNRFIEYAIPFVILAVGAFFALTKPYLDEDIIPAVRAWTKQNRKWTSIVATSLTISVLAILGNAVWTEYKKDYFRRDQYQFASDWIRENVPENDIIFTNVWDFGSILVYLDPTHRVLVGLDPRFMADPFPEKYSLMQEIIKGDSDKLSSISDVFHSQVVVVDFRSDMAEAFSTQLESSGLFHEVGRNEWVRLFSCLPDCGLPVSSSATGVTY